MPRASICKRRIETCARGMRWVRPLRASTEVEPLRAGPATDSPSPEAASVARVGLASKEAGGHAWRRSRTLATAVQREPANGRPCE